MRQPTPWERKGRGWHVNIDGKRHYLGKDKAKAMAEFHRLMSQRRKPIERHVTDSPTVLEICDRYILWLRANKSPATAKAAQERLKPFTDMHPDLVVAELRPHHVSHWVDAQDIKPATKRDRIAIVQRALRWGVRQGLIQRSPVDDMPKPAAERRDNPLTPEEFAVVLGLTRRQQSRDLLEVCWETGCRFVEITRVEARHLQGDRWVFPQPESKGKKKSRVVYLTATAQAICDRLAKKHPKGPLFRNSSGRPWNKFSVSNMLARLKDRWKGGRKFCLTDLRHSFATEVVKSSKDLLGTAALLGHKDGAMVAKVYAHLAGDDKHLRNTLESRQRH